MYIFYDKFFQIQTCLFVQIFSLQKEADAVLLLPLLSKQESRRTGPEALAHKHMCRSSSTFWNPAETQIMAVPVTDSFEPQAMEHVIFSLSYKRTVKFATLFLLGYFSP